MWQKFQLGLSFLLAAAPLTFPATSGKTSDLVTCSVVSSTDTLELGGGSQPEFARFGLIVCKPRSGAPPHLSLEFSSHGPLTVGFFVIPGGPGPQPSQADPLWLAVRLGLPQEKDWKKLLSGLRTQGKLTTVASGTIAPGAELWIGYVVTLLTDRIVKTDAEMMYAAGAMETEKLMTVSLERSLNPLEKFADALPGSLTTFLTNLLGVMAGAALSYFFFRRQQRIVAELDELKQFRERKHERADELLTFIRDVYYPDFRTDSDEVRKIRNIRTVLV